MLVAGGRTGTHHCFSVTLFLAIPLYPMGESTDRAILRFYVLIQVVTMTPVPFSGIIVYWLLKADS